MIDIEAGERAGSEDDLRPNPAILIGGAGAIGLISALSFVMAGGI
jgi:threonine dehydrogenase-like Zn-dependent dehydrogenase